MSSRGGGGGKSLIAAIGDTTRGTGARQIPQALPLWENQGENWGVDDGMVCCTGIEEQNSRKIQLS